MALKNALEGPALHALLDGPSLAVVVRPVEAKEGDPRGHRLPIEDEGSTSKREAKKALLERCSMLLVALERFSIKGELKDKIENAVQDVWDWLEVVELLDPEKSYPPFVVVTIENLHTEALKAKHKELDQFVKPLIQKVNPYLY